MRPTLGEMFMDIAKACSRRATCDRKHVGCVLARSGHVLSTGYNGSISGSTHCDEVGHFMVDGHCKRTIHAEANAVIQAAKFGVSVDGASAYITCSPCYDCLKMLLNAGIQEVYFLEEYGDTSLQKEVCKTHGVTFEKV